MEETNIKQSRFSVSEKSKIEDKYVLYTEDLHVSFVGETREQKIKNEIQMKSDLLDSLDKKSQKAKDLASEVEVLTKTLKKVEPKKKLKEKNAELKTAKAKNDSKTIEALNTEIEKLKQEIKPEKGVKKTVLKGVTLGLRQGETLALVGANGAGKTVMIETLLGINTPDSFEHMFINLGHDSYIENIREVGIQYQQSKIQPNLKVKDAIRRQASLYGDRVDFEEVHNMMEAFGIIEFISSKVESLSGGQKQRLNLLLAVLHQPKLMILDEFITGLDVKTVRNIITYINGLKVKNNASMIIISHQPEEIEELADRIIVLKEGKVVDETNPEEVVKKYGDMAVFLEEVI